MDLLTFVLLSAAVLQVLCIAILGGLFMAGKDRTLISTARS